MIETQEAVHFSERVRSGEFPDDHTQRFKLLLSIINVPPKAGVILFIPQTSTKVGDIESKIREASKRTAMKSSMHHNLRAYVNRALLPADFVKETTLVGDKGPVLGAMHYQRTENGNHYGVTTAALGMDYETTNSTSIREILGKTAAPSELNSPFIRAVILLALAQKDDVVTRRKELLEQLGITPSVLTENLRHLARCELINYDSVSRTSTSYVTFKKANEPPEIPENTLRKRVVDVCELFTTQGTAITTENVLRALDITGHPFDLKKQVSNILNLLARSTYLEKDEYANQNYSRAIINENGMKFVRDFLIPLFALASDEPHPRLEEAVHNVLPKTNQYFRNAVERYYPFSGNLVEKRAQDFASVLSFLQTSDRSVNVQEIAEALKLNKFTVIGYLKILHKHGPIFVTQKGVVNYYSFSKQEEEQQIQSVPMFIKHVWKALGHERRISIEDKITLLIYYYWVEYKSVPATAKILRLPESKIWDTIEKVQKNDELISAYDKITPEDDTENE
jgi:Mn-dependent DtxR family transcriptional regulator